MNLAEKYIAGLKQAYADQDADAQWKELEDVAEGVSPENLEKLRAAYLEIPETLVDLLKKVDGTYWRKYGDTTICRYFFGSPELEEYPYYLLSAEQMLERTPWKQAWLEELVSREADGCEVDEKITKDEKQLNWLHFSDCMNNGGSSKLFIDFSPSPEGVKGQVVCYVHDPDEVVVVADSFDEYLQTLMENEYDFINEDNVGDDE